MKKKALFLVLALWMSWIGCYADEGMWIPMLLKKYNIEDMQKEGFKLTAEDIYDINKASLKDAVIGLGREGQPFFHFCTGEIISNEGLVVTNHHCSFDMIQNQDVYKRQAVCCLISGAYVINDYFDTKSDRISGIKKVVVGKSISRRVAISLHTVLNLFAVSIAFYLGFAVGAVSYTHRDVYKRQYLAFISARCRSVGWKNATIWC